MSAGGLSYDCLTTYGKATLPSVEMWGTNMNILKDPNSGIFTRKRDKVGDTQSILLSQESSGDRIAEMINVYPRGVNPMVSVSYDNYSNNAGIRSQMSSRSPGVKLPYKPQVFYPPTLRQEDLMPLSRQPREWFYALSNPSMPNILSQMDCPDGKSAIQHNNLRATAVPNLEYTTMDLPRTTNIDTNSTINANTKNPQRNFLTTAVNDHAMGVFSGTKTDQNAIHENRLLYSALSNISGNRSLGDSREKIVHSQNKAITALKNKMGADGDVVVPNITDYERNPTFEHHNDLKGIHLDPLTTACYPNRYNQLLVEGQGSYEPSSGIQEHYVTVNANTRQTSGVTKNSDNLKGFIPIRTREPMHIASEIIPYSSMEKDNRNEGFEHFTPRAVYEDSKMGSWVVSEASKPFAGSDLLHNNLPKLNPKVFTDYYTKPSSSVIWKKIDPIIDSQQSTRRSVLSTNVTTNRIDSKRQSILPQERLNRQQHKNLPHFNAKTNVSSGFTKQVAFDSIGGGRIDNHKTPIEYYSNKSFAGDQTMEGRNDIYVKTKESMTIPVTSSIGNSDHHTGLDDILYKDSVHKTAIDDLYKSKQVDTVHNRTSLGIDFYHNVQGIDSSSGIHQDSSWKGSFESLGNPVPRFDRMIDQNTEMPVTERFMDVKKKAAGEFLDRYQNHPFPG